MATLGQALENLDKFINEFPIVVVKTIQENKEDIVESVREQISVGLDGDEKKLTPSYSADPFFSTKEAGRWKGKAKQYVKWKKDITPPARSWLGYDKRGVDTPNLYITGVFHESIKATDIPDGVRIASAGNVEFGKDIESKYGSAIFKLSPKAREFFMKHHLAPELKKLFAKYGQ
ncbi:hypothetical protein EZS27_003885 [termite gut metagenome]|uniref:Uncharacterized protein n=1 Tax=termite gut metagenome TaxID=433724 RepID=A0A5J4SS63_9ZZZZ